MKEGVKAGAPGFIAQAWDHGELKTSVAGVANLTTQNPMKQDFQFRIGSITKTFVATVILQLVGEGRMNLDDSVNKWLPGRVKGNGFDGNKITIRQLLNHTSGIADYEKDITTDKTDKQFLKDRLKVYKTSDLIKIGLSHKPVNKPGEAWSYSSTGYLLLGMIIEEATGKPYAKEIENRILKPLRMHDTYLPGTSTSFKGKNHARGYYQLKDKKTLVDVTNTNPSMAGASGEMISSTRDLNRFYSLLLRGVLLQPEQMKQMFNTVEATKGEAADVNWGLGIAEVRFKNGEPYWGHGGGFPGATSWAGGSRDGRHVMTVYSNVSNMDPDFSSMAEMSALIAEFSYAPLSR
ncbi:beta-lactamase family protein [Fictibacillus barbaricus]|uniref:Beta-lactamase family protein n=1 Tax=Fictibacillus barbaricus TaxID=182136 RepID=A0ABS2Z7V9_9BACL|nr:beta-lactamase family protein [Fictibacillus barbaricus]